MDFSEEWKSMWPISSVYPAPLLQLSGGGSGGVHKSPPSSTTTAAALNQKEIGPLIFNPSPHTLTQLYTSSSLSPHLPPPFPPLSLSRFIQTSSLSILPCTATSIASEFGPLLETADKFLNHNRLQLLRCPGTDSVLAFFPTGDNSNSIGFLVLSVENSNLVVKLDKSNNSNVFTAKNGFKFRISQLLVNPVGDYSCISSDDSCYTCVGYLIATTICNVSWYSVKIRGVGSDSMRPRLDFLGSKEFKSSAIAHACWSPHLPEESLVLLENGELFLFDVDSCSETWRLSPKYTGKRVRVSWDSYNVSERGMWLRCEFSWHPRILIVAHSSAVFLIDIRSEGCIVSCLLRIEILFNGKSLENDQFVAFSGAGSDGFYFIVASNHLLLLCDVRKPLVPLLRWSHSLANPNYITVFSLSELRSNSRDDEFEWASEAGYGILMGSFRNCEFGLFCYGPDTRGSAASKVSRSCYSFYAWELPSDLPLAASDCHCGSCVVNEEFWKGALPDWIDWRQKKDIVLGFGILDKDLFAQLSPPDRLGGFMLIRLTSCGKLESQSYFASSENVKASERTHNVQPNCFEDSLLYETGEAEYNFPKKYQYLEFKWLNAYLKSSLGKLLATELKGTPEDQKRKFSFGKDFHENMCQNLKACGLSRLQGSTEVRDVFKDISLPTSIHEIALRCVWSHLPMNLLVLSFCTHSELLKVPMKQKEVPFTNQKKRNEPPFEFLEVPQKPHLPPFSFRKPSSQTNKWSSKRLRGNTLLGPAVPLPFLLTASKLDAVEAEKLSADLELKLQCDRVMQVANEVCMSDSSSQVCSDYAVSLADDKEDMCYTSQIPKQFSLYKPVGFSDMNSTVNSFYDDERHTTVIYRARQNDLFSRTRVEMDGSQLFDLHCPVELKFNGCTVNFSPNELKTYKLLKRQFSNFKEGFDTYQDYLTRSNFQNYGIVVWLFWVVSQCYILIRYTQLVRAVPRSRSFPALVMEISRYKMKII